jgi:CDP-4-dehydro-6-deoxyglucose reductase
MKSIRLSPSGDIIKCQSGDTVLMALENAGYALPNNCRAGACGECKVKVLSGEFDQGLVLDMALSQEEREEGFGLMCMAKPLSDEMVIEWGQADQTLKLFPPEADKPYVVIEKNLKTSRIVELRLRPLQGVMRFWPGQYVQLNDREQAISKRSYSIANAPKAEGEITLQITRLEGGQVSSWIHDDVELGQTINISGPYGTFIGDPSVETPVICLAAGSGLAPILSLTEAALSRGFSLPVTLMMSAKTQADLYEMGLISYWQNKYKNFKFIPTLTKDTLPEYISGRIPEVLSSIFKDLSGHSVYIAGGTDFVESCTTAVKRLGAQEKLIHTEGYFSQTNLQ